MDRKTGRHDSSIHPLTLLQEYKNKGHMKKPIFQIYILKEFLEVYMQENGPIAGKKLNKQKTKKNKKKRRRARQNNK